MSNDLIEAHEPMSYCDCHACAISERNKLQAENARLRAALVRARSGFSKWYIYIDDYYLGDGAFERDLAAIDAALKGEE